MLWSIIGSSVSTLAIPLVTSQSFSTAIPIVSPIIIIVAVRVMLGCSQGMFSDSHFIERLSMTFVQQMADKIR